MKKVKILIFLSLIFTMTGCYNYRELNQLAITSAIGIDKKGAEYQVSIQVMNTQKQGNDGTSTGDQPKFVTYKEKGDTLQRAFRNIVLESPRRLYANHISLLVISEEVAKEGLSDVLDLLFRDTESRKQFIVLISKNSTSADVLEILTPLETLNSKNIVDSVIADNQFLGVSEQITYEQLMDSYLNSKKEIVLPSIEVIGNTNNGEETNNLQNSSPETKVLLSGYGIFKNDRLIGYLSDDDSINLSFLRNKIENTIIDYKCSEDHYMAVELVNSKTDIIAKKDKLEVTIKITGHANINELNCDMDITNDKTIDKLEKKINQKIEKDLAGTIEKINNKYNSDVYGFEDLFYKTNPKFYNKMKKKYGDDFLRHIDFKIKSDVNLFAKGNLLKVIGNEKQENK